MNNETLLEDKDVDPRGVALCKALSFIPGIRIRKSYCGYEKGPCRIWFEADRLEDLPPALRFFDPFHGACRDWRVIVKTSDGALSPIIFMIEGPTGERAYAEAKKIALRLTSFLAGEWPRLRGL